MLKWKDAQEDKPALGERVLLKIAGEKNPVVGYLAFGGWSICDANFEVRGGGGIIESFDSDEVTHYAEIGAVPD